MHMSALDTVAVCAPARAQCLQTVNTNSPDGGIRPW
jgi:hypothetical protein